ncbi:MAG TPA: AMP-binding protein [Polyangiaceae bacterium]
MTDPFDVFAAARQAPERLALAEPERHWTYAEMAALSARALGWLQAHGVALAAGAAESAVAVLAEPTPHQIAMTFALLAAGVPCLPVHPRLTESERSALLARAQSPLYVDTTWQHAPVVAPAATTLRHSHGPEAPLALVQTSGTTAGPRLACLSRRAFQASAAASAAHLGWTPNDRWLLALPFAHIGGLSILTRCLAARSAIALPLPTLAPRGGPGQNAARVAESLARLEVSLLSLVPTQLEQLLELRGWSAPSTLRAVLVGGAAASVATLERARARGLPVLASYGMTETCSQICTQALRADPPEAGVGHPLPGVEVEIVDGEIYARGSMLFSGYWGEAEVYGPSTWFATSDLGHIDAAGCLHVLGRLADRIISGGENVNPLEVEQVLAPAVAPRRLCVFGRDDALWGEQVAVAIEGAADPTLIDRLLLASQALAAFKRPRAVTFVEQLPELASGKLLRRTLKDSSSLALTPLGSPPGSGYTSG